MYSEIIGQPYEIEDDFVVGIYKLADFPEINMYINMETEKIMEVWVDEEL